MPIVYIITFIFGLGSLSISVSMKNQEKHMKILERKIIRTERENEQFYEFISECSIENSRIVN